MKQSVESVVVKIFGDQEEQAIDRLAVEEPLEIKLAYQSANGLQVKNLAVTMRTPGDDADLAAGFLFTEGIITSIDAISGIEYNGKPCSENKENSIQVRLQQNIQPNLSQSDRNFYTSSSCGVCGKASIHAIHTVRSVAAPHWQGGPVTVALLTGLPAQLAQQQKTFAATGGLHAAALFSTDGDLLLLREDVGRHNALDKLIGAALSAPSIHLRGCILLLSGRASFELIQKAAMAGIHVVAAVGAPSSLAVSLASDFGITLIGFLRNNRFNIYSGYQRIQTAIHENSY